MSKLRSYMSRPTSSTRKLSKTGGGASYSVTIPITLIRKLGWKERQKLVVTLRGTAISIKDWKK